MSNSQYYFNINISIIHIIAFALVIYSMYQIEKNSSVCKCSITPLKGFIKEWFIFMLCLHIISLIIGIPIILYLFSSFNNSYAKNFNLFKYILIIYGTILTIIFIIHFFMVVRTFLYLNYLRKSCICAYNLPEKILFWYFLITICIFITIITSMILITFIYYLYYKL
jgi:hypothetical protein